MAAFKQGDAQGGASTATSASAHSVEGTEIVSNDASRGGVYLFAICMFCVGFLVVLLATFSIVSPITVAIAVVAGFALAGTVRVVPQWERAVVLRLGKFHHIAGPGVYLCIPFLDHATVYVDLRVRTAAFAAEAALTADLVPVDVDAILFWMVWDPKKACFEVENYPKAVLRSAQTAMRDVIGQLNLADVSTRRRQIDHELEEALSAKCEEWGITVMSVEIRDIMIPVELQNALSKEAQAERERNARLLLAEVEKDISEMFVEAAEVYDRNPNAMKLRAMNLAYEGAKDSRGILLAPSALADSFDMARGL